jgi:hypothetical protein
MKNAERLAAGTLPDLAPFSRVGPVALDHVTGPTLRFVGSRCVSG